MAVPLKLEILANGSTLDVSDAVNYLWENYSGFGYSPIHRLITRGPQQHGDTDMGYLLDPRNLMVQIRILGTSIDDLFSKQSTLLQYCSPGSAPVSLKFTQVNTSTVRQIDGYVVSGFNFDEQEREGFTRNSPVLFRCNDPTWYNPTAGYMGFSVGGGSNTFSVPIVVPMGVGASTISASQVLNYTGTAPSFPWMTITGPITNCVITFSDISFTYTLDFTGVTINAGDTRVIDTRYPNKTVVDSAGANKVSDLTSASNLATLQINPLLPGETSHANNVNVAGSSANSATRIDINYYTRYIGV